MNAGCADADVAIPGRHFGADLVRHARLATRHLGMGETVEPRVIDLLRGSRNGGGERKNVRYLGSHPKRPPYYGNSLVARPGVIARDIETVPECSPRPHYITASPRRKTALSRCTPTPWCLGAI